MIWCTNFDLERRLRMPSCLLPLFICLVAGPAWSRPPAQLGLLPEPTGDLLGFQNPGDVPELPANGELIVEKVPVIDCRNVKALVLNPADGRVDSWDYAQYVSEWNGKGWSLPFYETVKDPGIHMTLAPGGFNYLYLRGGFTGGLYSGVDTFDGPGRGKLLHQFKDSAGPDGPVNYRFARLAFPKLEKSNRLSFFIRKNLLADAEFLRIGAPAKKYTGQVDFSFGEAVKADELASLGPDFIRLPAKPEDQQPSTFKRRFFRSVDRTVLNLGAGSTGKAITLPAEQQVHLITPVLPAGTPVGAVRVRLDLDAPHPGKLLNLTVQDPLEGGRELIRIDVRLGTSDRVDCTLDFPDQIMAQGRRFWVTLASQDALKLRPSSRVTLLLAESQKALAEYLDYRLYLLRGLFVPMSEARPWARQPISASWLKQYDGSDWSLQARRQYLLEMFTAVEHLRELVPDHSIAVRQYYDYLTNISRPPLEEKEVPVLTPIAGVPRWAQLMDRAVRETWRVPEWWIANRRLASGEFGNFFGDDTDLMQWWQPFVFMDSATYGAEVRHVFQVAAKLGLETKLKDGLNRVTMDPLHAYEEGQNHMVASSVLFYGDHRYVEWLMASVRNTEKLMTVFPDGSMNFHTLDIGWKMAREKPLRPVDNNEIPGILLHSHVALWWYNGNAHAADSVRKYVDHFGGYLSKGYDPQALNYLAYRSTGNPKYLGFPLPAPDGKYADRDLAQWSKRHALVPTHVPGVRLQPWWSQYQKLALDPAQVRNGDWTWAVAPDRKRLEKSLEYVLWGNPVGFGGGVERFNYMYTAAEQIDDRIFLPTEQIAQPMLGGYSVRNRQWPSYAISLDNLGGDFASLVLEQGQDRLKVAMVNLRSSSRNGAFRVWQLDPGRYELKSGPDINDDGELDFVETTKTLDLERMSSIPVELKPRRVTLYQIRQIKKYDDLRQRPDAALSEDDIAKTSHGGWTVTVHNIGNAALDGLRVAMLDGSGKVLESATCPRINPPVDLIPKTTKVELPGIPGAAKIILDPGNEIREITKLNNSVALPHPS